MNENAIAILADTMKDQANTARMQAEAMGKILESMSGLRMEVSDVKTLVGLVKDKSEILHRMVESNARDHKEILTFINGIKTFVDRLDGEIDEVKASIPSRDELMRMFTYASENINIESPDCPHDESLKNLKEDVSQAVEHGINASIMSLLKNKMIWIPIILFLLIVMVLAGVNSIELFDWIKIGS